MKTRDISKNIEDVENLDIYISPAQQIREMHKNYPDRVMPFAGEKDRENHFYAFLAIYHKTSYSERKKSGVIVNVKKINDDIYEVFDKCIYW